MTWLWGLTLTCFQNVGLISEYVHHHSSSRKSTYCIFYATNLLITKMCNPPFLITSNHNFELETSFSRWHKCSMPSAFDAPSFALLNNGADQVSLLLSSCLKFSLLQIAQQRTASFAASPQGQPSAPPDCACSPCLSCLFEQSHLDACCASSLSPWQVREQLGSAPCDSAGAGFAVRPEK